MVNSPSLIVMMPRDDPQTRASGRRGGCPRGDRVGNTSSFFYLRMCLIPFTLWSHFYSLVTCIPSHFLWTLLDFIVIFCLPIFSASFLIFLKLILSAFCVCSGPRLTRCHQLRICLWRSLHVAGTPDVYPCNSSLDFLIFQLICKYAVLHTQGVYSIFTVCCSIMVTDYLLFFLHDMVFPQIHTDPILAVFWGIGCCSMKRVETIALRIHKFRHLCNISLFLIYLFIVICFLW